MSRFTTCKCGDPKPNASGRVCSNCNGYIPPDDYKDPKLFVPDGMGGGQAMPLGANTSKKFDVDEGGYYEVGKDGKPKDTYHWFEENTKDYDSLVHTLQKVKNGEELYMKDPLFHKSIDMIVFYKTDPIKMIADLTVMITDSRKTMEDLISRQIPTRIIKDETKTK